MYYPDEVVEEVRDRTDIVDLISEHVQLKGRGGEYMGLCPFHNEKTPSFSVSRNKQFYYCFGCHASGNVYTFLMQYEHYSFQQAVQYCAQRAGVTLPETEDTPEQRRAKDKRQRLFDINKDAATYFYRALRSEQGSLGMEYFQKRELTPETMQSFGLGYSLQYSDDLVKYLKKKGYPDELIIEAGLATFSEKYGLQDRFYNRVMFPIMDQSKHVIAFGGRVMGEGKPKYLNSRETPIFEKRRNLYGLQYARNSKSRYFILCEGYMDVIAMHQAGFNQAVASLGTAFTEEQADLLKRFTQDVLLAYDSDGAGTNAALEAIRILESRGMAGKVINMKPHKDPDEFIKNLGKEAFEERIRQAENGFLFEIRMLRRDYNTEDPTEDARFNKELVKRLTRFADDLERESYIKAAAREYHIDPEKLRRSVREEALKRPQERTASRSEIMSEERKKASKAEDSTKYVQRLLLTWLSEEPGRYRDLKGLIDATDFTDPMYAGIAAKLFESIEAGEVKAAGIINMFEDPEQQQAAALVFHTRLEEELQGQDREKAFHDILVGVKRNSVEQYKNILGSDASAFQKMLEAKKALEKLESGH